MDIKVTINNNCCCDGDTTGGGTVNTAPIITLVGDNPQEIVQGSAYIELGATATDTEDGDLTNSIVTDSTAVDIATIGTYTVNYTVTDSGGIVVTASRVVNVVTSQTNDTPVITILGNNPDTVDSTQPIYTDAGATATDTEDGDLTNSVVVVSNDVDMLTQGNYTIGYSVTDSDNNTTTANRTVTVRVPTMSLYIRGREIEQVLVGEYVEQGAWAEDTIDGTIEATIFSSDLDIDTVGDYLVTYEAINSRGQKVRASRSVEVVAVITNNQPIITITGDNPKTYTVGDIWIEDGATATDVEDGIVNVDVQENPAFDNTDTIHNTLVMYTAIDNDGNIVNATREVNVVASATNHAPTLTLLGNNPQYILLNDAYTEQGAVAVDEEDGIITSNIVIDSNFVNTSKLGNYRVSYSVTDADNNKVTVSREIQVVNVLPSVPTITLLGDNPAELLQGSVYNDDGVTASDPTDGDITANVTTVATIDNNVVGTYLVTYTVTNSVGNTTTTVREVNVILDTNVAPTISILGDNPIEVLLNSTYTDAGATASDAEDGDITANITTNSTVDTANVGNYTVVYTVSDSNGVSTSETRNVTVVTIIGQLPTITVLGDNPLNVAQDTVYTDQGATASDPEDGDITADIVVNNPIDMAVVGTYTVTYTVADADNNTVTATRTVNVIGDNGFDNVVQGV